MEHSFPDILLSLAEVCERVRALGLAALGRYRFAAARPAAAQTQRWGYFKMFW